MQACICEQPVPIHIASELTTFSDVLIRNYTLTGVLKTFFNKLSFIVMFLLLTDHVIVIFVCVSLNALKLNHVGSVQGFGAGTRADMILNTMAWSRREVVVLPDKQAESVGTDQQVDTAGNCLGILSFYLCSVILEVLYVTKVLMKRS